VFLQISSTQVVENYYVPLFQQLKEVFSNNQINWLHVGNKCISISEYEISMDGEVDIIFRSVG